MNNEDVIWATLLSQKSAFSQVETARLHLLEVTRRAAEDREVLGSIMLKSMEVLCTAVVSSYVNRKPPSDETVSMAVTIKTTQVDFVTRLIVNYPDYYDKFFSDYYVADLLLFNLEENNPVKRLWDEFVDGPHGIIDKFLTNKSNQMMS